jgi:preprotein translocase subunit SecF
MFIILFHAMTKSKVAIVTKIRLVVILRSSREWRLNFVQQFQGNLIVTLKDSIQTIDDNEVRRKFQQFGDVKSVMPVGDRAEYVGSLSNRLVY